MVGYAGKNASDAGEIIDRSQGRPALSREYRALAHPRGHSMAPESRWFLPTDYNCVEEYSRGCHKSAFVSRDDQNLATHVALCSEQGKKAMDKLNAGSENEQVKIDIRYLDIDMVNFDRGQIIARPKQARYVVLVLRHAMEKNSVHVHNSYPSV